MSSSKISTLVSHIAWCLNKRNYLRVFESFKVLSRAGVEIGLLFRFKYFGKYWKGVLSVTLCIVQFQSIAQQHCSILSSSIN